MLFIMHVPSLKMHTVLVHRTPIVQVSWNGDIDSGLAQAVISNEGQSFWGLALICRGSSHLYLWCRYGCASVMFPKLASPSSGEHLVRPHDVQVGKLFLPSSIRWMVPSYFGSQKQNSPEELLRLLSRDHPPNLSNQSALIAADLHRFVLCFQNHIS
jgi:hypothetical protein